MMDGDAKTITGPTTIDAPDLGAHVELVEGNVGDAMMLMDSAGKLPRLEFLLLAVSVSLRIDGRRYTLDELKAMPGRKARALLGLANQAMALNQFFPATDDESEDDAPKS
jgi:hypothetical protein